MEDLHSFLRSRRSIRRFRSDPVAREILERILETATYTPSAHNKQPWRFVVLVNSKSRLRLLKAVTKKFRRDMEEDGIDQAVIRGRIESTTRRIHDAPIIIVLCQDTSEVNTQPDKERQQVEQLMGLQSASLAGLVLLLAAQIEGLGGTWICWSLFAQNETRAALDLAPNWNPIGMFFIGYPAEIPEIPQRIPLSKIVVYK
jgi:coenzyme F420-0:L-glutamate ligase / coenzyme F420-1:gamma-L-glutamate ligase